jgi:solute carrier family 35 protein
VVQVTLLLSCVLGLTINHSTFICTRYNDPLTTSVAGSLKNIIMTLIGAVSFGDFVFAKWNVVGLGVSMAGAIWYATRAAIKVRSP